MKIKNILNPQEFFLAVAKCKGRVELLTSEGDRLNMRSALCQYIALTQMFQDDQIEDVELCVSVPEDLAALEAYLVIDE